MLAADAVDSMFAPADDILLVKAEWLIDHFKSGGLLLRRQDLPPLLK